MTSTEQAIVLLLGFSGAKSPEFFGAEAAVCVARSKDLPLHFFDLYVVE